MTTLLQRLTVFNIGGFAAVYWAWSLGYVRQVFEGDISHISYGIAALFAVGLVDSFRGGRNLPAFSEWLVTLGLIANVIGFILALDGVNASSLGTPEATQKVAAQLLAGMGVAFYGTLVGAVTALWLSVNSRILAS